MPLSRIALCVVLLGLLPIGCVDRPLERVPTGQLQESTHYFPQTLEKDIDILFVIDNSKSMLDEQINLANNFPRLIDALRNPKLGPDGSGRPCVEGNTSGCKIPNVHIGVVTTDMGIRLPGHSGCTQNGDAARLQSQPRGACVGPSDPYISYIDGVTNVNDPSTKDGVEQVKQAFSCIAQLGIEGCGFEHPLEAARRALDANVNPGFQRKDAFLAVVFITDEDDCSAQNPQMFNQSVPDPFGFRCFEYGIRCNINDSKPGPRKGCRPLDDPDSTKHWLFPVTDYVAHFKGLKPPGRVILSAIAGDTDSVVVGSDPQGPFLQWTSCQGKGHGKAAPAIRLRSVVDAFSKQGYFSTICIDNFGPALKQLGELIITSLGGQCLSAPPLSAGGGLACHAGDALGLDRSGVARTCQVGCLDQVECVVELTAPDGSTQPIQRCEPSKFDNLADEDCGARCPCWRVVPKPAECLPGQAGSPYGMEVLRKDKPVKGSAALARCATTPERWASVKMAEMPQCN